MTQREEKIQEILRELAAEFFSRESNRLSLITVTGVELQGHGTRATILITVLPIEKEKEALEFIHRRLADFRQYVLNHSRLGHVPFFDTSIDAGEKNRQKIEELS